MRVYKVMQSSKVWKYIVLTLFFLAGVMMAIPQHVQAATAVKVQKKAVAYTDIRYTQMLDVTFPEKGDYIKNLRTDSGNLKVMETEYHYSDTLNQSKISYYAKKAGTYKITFDVYKANNKKRSSHGITVYASKFQGFWKVDGKYFKKCALQGGSTDRVNYYTTASSGKIVFVLPKGCKLVKLQKSYYTSAGKTVTTRISNGAMTSFNRSSNLITASTEFMATYKDSYTNKTHSMNMIVVCLAK